jgi:HSP20 family molecular chaperone IbpA
MAKPQSEESNKIQVKKPNSILQDLTELHDTISKRAYEFFQENGLLSGPLADWFRAEREIVWRPAIELRQKDGQFELEAALAGVDPKNLDVQVTPEDILITAAEEHRHEGTEGTVHVSEFSSGRLFRSVHLPERIDPESVKAEFKNGMLHLTAAVAKTATKKVDVQAA